MTTITLRASSVVEACMRYLGARHNRINAERERLIAEAMAPRGWLRRRRSREQAIKHLQRRSALTSHLLVIPEWHWHEINELSLAGQLTDLLLAARLARDEGDGLISTDEATAILLFDYLD